MNYIENNSIENYKYIHKKSELYIKLNVILFIIFNLINGILMIIVLKNSNSIFYLFSKIDNDDIKKYRKYFK